MNVFDERKPGKSAKLAKIGLDFGMYEFVVVPNLSRLDALVAVGVKPSQILLGSEISFDPGQFYEIYVDEAAEISEQDMDEFLERVSLDEIEDKLPRYS